jgi:hypothetical protein
MLANSQGGAAVDQLDDLFGEPPLIRGEDKARYWRLHGAIAHQMKPITVLDKMRVRDTADKLWQQQRCKQSTASIIESAFVEALMILLRPFNSPGMGMEIGEDAATELARNYYNGEATPKEEEKMECRLAQYFISPEQIRAKAMQICGPDVLIFNRMETHCEASLRMLQKESDRRNAVESAKARVSDPAEG